MEYKIEISMTFDEDMLFTPYRWCLIGRDAWDWRLFAHGWAKSPEEAWRQAYECYNDITKI